MFYAISSRYLIGETRTRSQISSHEMCNKNMAIRQAFLRVLGFFLCQYHSNNAPYSAYLSGYLHKAFTKRTKSGKPSRKRRYFGKLGRGGGATVQKRTFTFYSSLQVFKGEHVPRFQSEIYS